MRSALLISLNSALAMPGVTQESLGKLCGMSASSVSRIKGGLERGEKVDPPARLAVAVAEVLGLATDDVLGFAESRGAGSRDELEKRLAEAEVERDILSEERARLVVRIAEMTSHAMRQQGRGVGALPTTAGPLKVRDSLEMMEDLSGDIDRILDEESKG